MFEHGLSLHSDVFLQESPSPDNEELFSHIYVKSHGAQVAAHLAFCHAKETL